MQHIKADDYFYDLPECKIAVHPVSPRDTSKLLIAKDGSILQTVFSNIADYLPEDSVIIFNETKVIPARLLLRKETGALVEFLLLDPSETSDPQVALRAKGRSTWKCFVGNAAKIRDNQISSKILAGNQTVEMNARIIENRGKEKLVEFIWTPSNLELGIILEYAGHIPLPPYIRREDEARDRNDYQPVFARNEGSVAAPTASLHFTKEVIEKLKKKNINPVFLTLHVGAGTFQPVENDTASHKMHCERFSIERHELEILLEKHDKPWIVCGTTALRTIESLLIKGFEKTEIDETYLAIEQWDAVNMKVSNRLDRKIALEKLVNHIRISGEKEIRGETSVFIIPGVTIHSADYLITNFHQPRSTLLMLVDAFASAKWGDVYQYALANNFRFLSFGDVCLFENKNPRY